MIKFTLNGRAIRPDDIADALMKAAVESVANQMRERLNAVRHPETGEFPTVVISGESLETLSFRVEGSPELLALVRERLGPDSMDGLNVVESERRRPPKAFLSYAWEDRDLAEAIASALQAGGIDTWWAGWSLGPGDSLRQKIDEGLADCTHFIVLLTPQSVSKPWINQEMDAGLVRKLEERVRFIALRHDLPAGALPPLLKGMISPAIDSPDADLRQLINDIHGVSRKPVLGAPPPVTGSPNTGYSAAASAVAKVFVDDTRTAVFGDPQRTLSELAQRTGLSVDDIKDAVHELGSMVQESFDRVLPRDELFATFDRFWKEWHPAEDALRLAADLVNDDGFPGSTPKIAERYGWPPRRINPAIAYLVNRAVIMNSKALGTQPWITAWVQKTDATRRFVRSRA